MLDVTPEEDPLLDLPPGEGGGGLLLDLLDLPPEEEGDSTLDLLDLVGFSSFQS